MVDGMTLKGRAIGMYGSLENFSKKVGWSYAKTYRLLTGRQTMTVVEFRKVLDALDVSESEAAKVLYFLTSCSQT